MISLNIYFIREIRNARRLPKVSVRERMAESAIMIGHVRCVAIHIQGRYNISAFYSIETISARIRAHSPVDDDTHTLIPIFQN